MDSSKAIAHARIQHVVATWKHVFEPPCQIEKSSAPAAPAASGGGVRYSHTNSRHIAASQHSASELRRRRLAQLTKYILAHRLRQTDAEPVQIIQGIWIGSIGAATNLEALQKVHITHIVCAASGVRPLFAHHGFKYLMVNILDTPVADIAQYFKETCEFMHNARESGGNVFIHCFAGRSRSATFIAAYLIQYLGYSLESAFALLRAHRPIVQPNEGFIQQLRQWEHTAQTYRSTGVCSAMKSEEYMEDEFEMGHTFEQQEDHASTSSFMEGPLSALDNLPSIQSIDSDHSIMT